jgi:hypothetical protein
MLKQAYYIPPPLKSQLLQTKVESLL